MGLLKVKHPGFGDGQVGQGGGPPAGPLPAGYNRGDFNQSAILFSAFPHEDFTDLTPATLEAALIANAYGFNSGEFTTTELVTAPSTGDGGPGRYLWVQTNPVLGKEFVCLQGAHNIHGPITIKHFASLNGTFEDLWSRVVYRVAGPGGSPHQAPPTPTPIGTLLVDEFGRSTGDYNGGDNGKHAFSNTPSSRSGHESGQSGKGSPPNMYAGTGTGFTFTISPDPGFTTDQWAGVRVMALGNGYDPGVSLPPVTQGTAAPILRSHVIAGGGDAEAEFLRGHIADTDVASNTSNVLTINNHSVQGATHIVLGGDFPNQSWKTQFQTWATGNVRLEWINDFQLSDDEPGFIPNPTTNVAWQPSDTGSPPVGAFGPAVDYSSNRRSQNNHAGLLAPFFTRSDYFEFVIHSAITDNVAHDGMRDVFMRRLTVNGVFSPGPWAWRRFERTGGTNSLPMITFEGFVNKNGPSDRDQYFCTAQLIALDGSVDGDPFGIMADLGLPTTAPYGVPGDPTT